MSMSLAGDYLRLFKFVPDEFVVHLPRYSACGLASTGQRKHWSRHKRLVMQLELFRVKRIA
ncbi:hypothetical protein K800_11776 [Salmonella enterica subsp. enterica serovar Newport str. SHSN010]|nr:hypothetical protein STU288_02770 [Salmonella enterica subsp. enterica serovar Typhimurium str. U288]ELX23808.1 hypothetical protein SE451200_22199 [Salmonella enterica subsp. enterica serovar 4 [Salmonella enterica subsp. enterica serovar 4 [Salmonella enterica subsp. enterica serovar 4,[5],12:i:- str. 08-1700]ELX32103.1 hypothetical protein SE451239_09365 [Salmonella enterica subsp. enterica serovar 4 [Salmonella enterica subsp. enterica serovar 4 [Salmonella enterica subsp. enterica serovar